MNAPIMARAAVQQYVGYCFWAVALRTGPKHPWDKAVKRYGRTDTTDQSWGEVFELVKALPLEGIRSDTIFFKWKDVRESLWFAGEGNRQEGSKVWSIVSPARRSELSKLGAIFNEKLKFAESERQRINRERDRQYYSQFTTALKTPLPSQYLKALGLSSCTTSLDEIKTAYRRLASRYHPDKGGDAVEFIKIRKAYESLLVCM